MAEKWCRGDNVYLWRGGAPFKVYRRPKVKKKVRSDGRKRIDVLRAGK